MESWKKFGTWYSALDSPFIPPLWVKQPSRRIMNATVVFVLLSCCHYDLPLISHLQIYVGSVSHPEIKERFESAKLVLSIGSLKSDINTGGFTYGPSRTRTVEVT
jgi:TPP-dependent 2-oxoacid decarboxylase